MKNSILTGPNLRLRALEPGDVDLLYAWENDTAIWNVSNTLTPFSKFQLEEYVLNSQNDIFTARQLRLIVVLTKSDEGEMPVGTIDLFDFDPFHLRAGVGILVREPYRKNGFALEALQILIRYAFTSLRLHQIFCNISPENASSIRLFKKIGFERSGIKREWNNYRGKWEDEWMFQLINHDA